MIAHAPESSAAAVMASANGVAQAAPAPPIIEVEGLVKRYKKATANAVDDISFTVQPGEFFTLLGPNGAGKTTTISILTTTLSPTAGTVRIAGYDTERHASAVRRNVGIIFQKPSLDLNVTAEENVRFHAVLYGLYPYRPTWGLMPGAYQRQVHDLARILGIDREIFKPVRTYSGGMKRKLEILRSLIHRPRVLFLDEPTVGLDPESRRNLWEYLKKVREESQTTIFLTTHYLDEAEGADRVCIIDHGRIVSLGTPDQVKADLTEAYLLLDAADRIALRAELARLGFGYAEVNGGLVRVPLNGATTAQRVIKALETPLTVLKTHAPTLEDAYLAIVARTAEEEQVG